MIDFVALVLVLRRVRVAVMMPRARPASLENTLRGEFSLEVLEELRPAEERILDLYLFSYIDFCDAWNEGGS